MVRYVNEVLNWFSYISSTPGNASTDFSA